MISERLSKLIATVHPPHRGPYSAREISDRAQRLGFQLSESYVHQLRNGKRANPTIEPLVAIAAVFDVPVEYFFTDREGEELQADLALARAMNDAGIRDIALRAADLSPEARQAVVTMLQQFQNLDTRAGRAQVSPPGEDGSDDGTISDEGVSEHALPDAATDHKQRGKRRPLAG
jgi:transcriptional regulator with XRE-family HTH domain